MPAKLDELKKRVLNYFSDADLSHIDTAYELALERYTDKNNNAFTHALDVANALADMHMDVGSIAAGLLHDMVESNLVTLNTIERKFGEDMSRLLEGVTQLSYIARNDKRLDQAEKIRHMFLAIANDLRVIFIKLMDRIQTMKEMASNNNQHQLSPQSHEHQKDYAQETMDIYAPIAHRLGLYNVKQNLEDLAFARLLPDKYSEITENMKTGQKDREAYVTRVKNILHKKMAKANIQCHILGRHKHLFSIYQKMVKQNLPFEEIYDIIAFRIILNTVTQCYEVLGIIHETWKPIPTKIKDYIAAPKANMYQSLHTTVYGPNKQRIEIQIRTWDMDFVANSGVAAHWSYKESKTIDRKTDNIIHKLQEMIEDLQNYTDPNEFLEHVKIDLFPDDVYVFTPNGDVISLPQGATPVDFAYAIHSEVGNHCNCAKVNGKIKPLRYQLNTGDHIEVITSKKQKPGKNWLNFVKTAKAKSRIRQSIRLQNHEKNLTIGRDLCEKEFKKHKLSFSKALKSEDFEKIRKNFKYKTVDDLIAAVGYGDVSPRHILHYFVPLQNKPRKASKKIEQKTKRFKSGILVKGIDDVLVRLAKCCNPLPGDDIIGNITRGQGITVHKTNCINAMKISPERQMDVEWNSEKSTRFSVEIGVLVSDRIGLLADISTTISQNNSNIVAHNTHVFPEGYKYNMFLIEVNDTIHLEKIIREIKRIRNVKEVRRKKN